MSKIQTALRFFKEDRGAFMAAIVQNFFRWLPDKPYLQLLYRFKMGHRLDLKNPKTFTEKLQWLKLYNRRPEYTNMVDKYAVKKYVADIIGEEYIIPTLGVWDKPEDINWDALPNQFVLKTTHGGGGGGVVICKDKQTFNRADAIAKLNQSMHSDIYSGLREWPYKNVTRRIIAEKFMAEQCGVSPDLIDYKFYCFNGVPKLIMVANGRSTGNKRFGYYDTKWNTVDIRWGAPKPEVEFTKPDNLNEMIKIASKLSSDLVHARIDLYNIDSHTYFGEITFYDGSGFEKIEPQTYDEYLGSLMKLNENHTGGVKIKIIGKTIECTPIAIDRNDLRDYKFFCFDGEPKFLYISDSPNHELVFLNTDWTEAEFGRSDYKPLTNIPPKPDNLDEMLDIARKLSKGKVHVRVDLYNVNKHIYFGELTFYTGAGFIPFTPKEYDKVLGEMIKLPSGGVKFYVINNEIIKIEQETHSEDLKDYKFFCFNGKVKCFKIDFGRFVEHHANYYSPEGKLLPFGEKAFEPDSNHIEIMPENLNKMISIAEQLSNGFKFLRVDLYNIKGKIYFGELTFYPASGMGAFVPNEWDEKLGSLLLI